MMLFRNHTPVNDVQFKTIKWKKIQDFFIDTSSVYTRIISQEQNHGREIQIRNVYIFS